MDLKKFLQKALFRLRVTSGWSSLLHKIRWRLLGVKIGNKTTLSRIEVNWPHQLQLGNECLLEPDITFKFDNFWQEGPQILIGNRVFLGRNCEFNIAERIEIGDDCLIGSGCRFIDHNHGVALNSLIREQPSENQPITLENDVWLGVNVVVLKGVHISSGAIIGAGAIVTKSIGPREIWAGVPARQIGIRN